MSEPNEWYWSFDKVTEDEDNAPCIVLINKRELLETGYMQDMHISRFVRSWLPKYFTECMESIFECNFKDDSISMEEKRSKIEKEMERLKVDRLPSGPFVNTQDLPIQPWLRKEKEERCGL